MGALGTPLEILVLGLVVFVPPRGGFVGHVLAFQVSGSKRIVSGDPQANLQTTVTSDAGEVRRSKLSVEASG